MKRTRTKGFSLIEVMVGVVVLGILISVVVPSFADLLNRRRIAAVAAEIATDLAYARSEAGIRSQSISLDFMQTAGNSALSCYTMSVSQATFGSCICSRDVGPVCSGFKKEIRTMLLPNDVGVKFTAASPSWGRLSQGKIDFVAPQMFASLEDFYVVVEGRGGKLKIELSGLGRVSTCSPDGSITGYKPCE